MISAPNTILVAALCCTLMAGCATRSFREDSKGPDTPLLTTYQAQVSLGPCVFKGEAPEAVAGLAAALLSSAVAQGVNVLGNALAEAAKPTNDTVSATRNIEVKASNFGPCAQFVRGWFYRGFADSGESVATFNAALGSWAGAAAAPIDSSKLRVLWQRRMWLATQPDFVFEAQVVPSKLVAKPDTTLLTLVPVYARLDHPISRALLRPSQEREVAAFFAFHEATADPAAPGTATGGLVLGRLEPGRDVRFPPPDVSPPGNPNLPNNRAVGESRWFSLPLGAQNRPMAVTALVTEHQDASAFLQFVADVFNGAKTPITTALQQAIVPGLREQAEETERVAAETARGAYEDALVKALAAATTCAATTPTDPLGAAADVRAKLRTLNKNARATGKSTIDENQLALSRDASTVQQACVMVRDQLRDAVGS